MNVVLVYGGKSGEHEISLLSATSIGRALKREHSLTLIAIDKSGKWYRQSNTMLERIRADDKATLSIECDEGNMVTLIPGGGCSSALNVGGESIPTDIVLCALHGQNGEDGTIQGLLEMLDVPYTGNGVLASCVTMDKDVTKNLLILEGMDVVPWRTLRISDFRDCEDDNAKRELILGVARNLFHYPLFIKPASAGSSEGAHKANNEKEVIECVKEAFKWDDKILIEHGIDAREIECAVMGDSMDDSGTDPEYSVRSYIPGEIDPHHDFYDYDAKYNDPHGAALWIPARIDDKKLKEIKKMAEKAYRLLHMSGMARVDFFIDRKDKAIYINEINSIPGFTSISMFPKMCNAGGIAFEDILESLIAQGLNRYKVHSNIRHSL